MSEIIVGGITIALTFLVAMLSYIIKFSFSKGKPPKSYGERLFELTSSLIKASSEVDAVLSELTQVAKDRENSAEQLEKALAGLEEREKELKERIDTLQNVPIPVAEYFAKLVEPSEKRSAKRDYLLFGAGVLVTTVIAIIMQIFTNQ
jgi:hypothetical protein